MGSSSPAADAHWVSPGLICVQGRPLSSLQRLLWADPCLRAKAYCVQTLTCLQTPAESGSLRACQRAGHADADIKHPCVAPERVPASFCTEVHARSPMPVSGDVCTLRYPRLCRYHEQIKTLRPAHLHWPAPCVVTRTANSFQVQMLAVQTPDASRFGVGAAWRAPTESWDPLQGAFVCASVSPPGEGPSSA